MTQTIDTETSWPTPTKTMDGTTLILPPAEQTADYARRIHWWVRLFGIVWIVIPVVATIMAVFFAVGIVSMGAVNSKFPTTSTSSSSSSYSSCVAQGYGTTTCRAIYPR